MDLRIVDGSCPPDYGGDSRTPLAWQHRDYKFHKSSGDNFGFDIMDGSNLSTTESFRHMSLTPVPDYYGPLVPKKKANTCFRYHHHPRRALSPNSIGSSVYEPDRPVDRIKQRISRNGRRRGAAHSLRSVQSVPVIRDLATWDGEPCPVHHSSPLFFPPHPAGGRAASTYDLRLAPLSPPPPLRSSSPQPSCLQHQLVIPAKDSALPHLLPLPVRNPNTASSLPTSTEERRKRRKHFFAMRGGLTVFWVIVCVIVLGILLGLVLCFTIA